MKMFLAGTYAQLGEKENAFATPETMINRRAVMFMAVAPDPLSIRCALTRVLIASWQR